MRTLSPGWPEIRMLLIMCVLSGRVNRIYWMKVEPLKQADWHGSVCNVTNHYLWGPVLPTCLWDMFSRNPAWLHFPPICPGQKIVLWLVSVAARMAAHPMRWPIRMLSILFGVDSPFFIVQVIVLLLSINMLFIVTVHLVLTIRFWSMVWDNVSVQKAMVGYPVIM